MFCAEIASLSNISGPHLVILFDVEPMTPGLNFLFVIPNILVLRGSLWINPLGPYVMR